VTLPLNWACGRHGFCGVERSVTLPLAGRPVITVLDKTPDFESFESTFSKI